MTAFERYRDAIDSFRQAVAIGDPAKQSDAKSLAAQAWRDHLSTLPKPEPTTPRDWLEDRQGFGPTIDPDAPVLTVAIPSDTAKAWDRKLSANTLATIGGLNVEKYDVVQVNRAGQWLDFATLKDVSDVRYAAQMLRGTHPEPAWRGLNFRISRHCGAPIVSVR